MATLKECKLQDFRKGEVWLVGSPMRIARIGDPTTAMCINPRTKEPEERPALRVRATIPTVVIPGLLSAREAAGNARIRRAVAASCAGEIEEEQGGSDDTEWEEIWASRRIFPVMPDKRVAGNPLYVNDAAVPVEQTYCHEEIGRHPSRAGRRDVSKSGLVSFHGGSSSARGHVIEAARIPREQVPPELFRGDAQEMQDAAQVTREEVDGQGTPDVEARLREDRQGRSGDLSGEQVPPVAQMSWNQLRARAKALGIKGGQKKADLVAAIQAAG